MKARLGVLSLLLGSSLCLADPSGRHWAIAPCSVAKTCAAGTTCVGDHCAVQYRIATSIENTGAMNINGGLSYASFIARAEAAFSAWNEGRVECTTTWNSAPGPAFSTPAGTDAISGQDQLNNIIWLGGTFWTHLENELAITTTSYTTATNEIFDADMEYNNNVKWSDNLADGTYDAESIVLHEAGHFLGLNHSRNASAVMYPTVQTGVSHRVLTAMDQADVCAVYPGEPGSQGTSCTADGDCTGDRVCRSRADATAKICTQACTTPTCSAGYTCQNADVGMACLPQVGAPDLCRTCQSGGECSSGLCLRFESTGVTFCSMNCTETAQCGPNYTCEMPQGFCVPNAMTCTNQCSSASQCATGYDCTAGTCTPRGDTGDLCTVSLFCKACNVCTRESADSALSFCRRCCQGMGQGGACNSCPDLSCGASSTCASLITGNASVCIGGALTAATCQSCNNGQCAEGLQCIGNRCRTACNPASPGACSACFSLTGGSGVCACADEVASEGQPCGQIGNTLATCGTGLECVATPSPACRAKCTVGTTDSCRVGQSCQLINGVGVCMPGTPGSTCAACTAGGSCNSGLSCYQGRCYAPCNTNVATACSSCVQSSADGSGVCGCQDQLSPEGGPCGIQPQLLACQIGTKCLGAVCRAQCDPSHPNCPLGTSCQTAAGESYCTETSGAGGGSGGNDAGSGGGGIGAGGGGSTNLGCGCTSGGQLLDVLGLAVIGLIRWRRVAIPGQGKLARQHCPHFPQ